MPTYAIGDIQGCYDHLVTLLNKFNYQPKQDKLWFAGDLVNRGPKSLETLRLVRHLDPEPIVVLGNHDLHLLALAEDAVQTKGFDNLDPILMASDRDDLLNWLRHRPLLHHDEELGYTMMHAGLHPKWCLSDAITCAKELEIMLRGENYHEFLKHMYGDEPKQWDPDLTGWERLRFICNVLTRMRFCDEEGRLNLKTRGVLGTQAANEMPWFDVPNRANQDLQIIFGHWAALEGKTNNPNVIATDSGCVWGNCLTAIRLEDGERITVAC